MTSDFDMWATVYDSVFSYVENDISFYLESARGISGSVLELGCGTGRVTLPIAESGIEIVGIDSSSKMLDVAKNKAKASSKAIRSLTLLESDMRDFSIASDFALIIIPYRGFLSLLTVEDQIRTLKNIKQHMRLDGRLIFNIFQPDLHRLTQDGDTPYHYRDVVDPNTGNTLVLWNQSSYDNHNQIVSTRMIVEELDDECEMIKRFYRDFQLRYIHRWEMHHLLELCQFEVLDLYGDFDGSVFDESSTEMVWVAGHQEA